MQWNSDRLICFALCLDASNGGTGNVWDSLWRPPFALAKHNRSRHRMSEAATLINLEV